jgi:hypothetical protein
MAPFLVRHPVLVHRWMTARERALARVRSLDRAGAAEWDAFRSALERARELAETWRTEDAVQSRRISALQDDLARLSDEAERAGSSPGRLWDRLYRWAEAHLSLEGQECTVSLLLEPHGALVDDLCAEMSADEELHLALDGRMDCRELSGLIERHYAWALAIDFEDPDACARFWYVSAEKLEPRLGERHQQPGADLEQPLGFARDVAGLLRLLAAAAPDEPVASLVLRRPELRHAVRRVQVAARLPYAEIRDNLIGARLRPVDLLRFKLAFFGANRFDPRSDRWLRICLFQDAPFPDEIGTVASGVS